MVEIPEITIICVDTMNHGRASLALKKCLKQVKPARCVFLTNIEVELEGIEVIQIPEIKSKKEYSQFVIKELHKYFYSSHVLLIQHDGYILDGSQFGAEFLEWDYIGASWLETDGYAVGNGGFSVRSHRLCNILAEDETILPLHPEDNVICRIYRPLLEEKYGIKFAPVELADKFSFELKVPVSKTFGFHGYFHEPYKPTIVIRRMAALGDLVQLEPVLFHFYKKGYRIVLDTLPQFFRLYQQHYFKIHHPEEIDGRLLANAKRYDLDMSYESKPKQLHLKTYFEYCEVSESEMDLRNPSLNLNIEKSPGTKLFKKYFILHLATRKQGGRNVQGAINWPAVVLYLKEKGYDTIQIGGGDEDAIPGALQMMTPGEPFLMWVIREADGFLGIDSGPSNIAVSFDVPAAIFFGNVDPKYIYADLSNIEVIENAPNCGNEKCWHREIGCEGMECIVDEKKPPCVQFTHESVITAMDNICNKMA
jgi:hypothetical protein